MEFDDFKSAWQTLDRRLQLQNTLALADLRERSVDKARSGLRPLFWGQLAQMLSGLFFIVLAVSFWPQHRDVPHLLLAGLVVHVYGVACIALSGITLGLMRIDHAAPVLAIQKQLARLRRFYIVNGMIVGLSWWLLWVPVMIVVVGLLGMDLYVHAPSVVWIGIGIGIAGLLATWWFHRWSHQSVRAQLGKRVDDSAAGGSIRRTQRILDEIARFEHE